MLTQIEQQTLRLIQSACKEYLDSREPDWEQRRHEIAKDFATRMFATPAYALNTDAMVLVIRQSIVFADTLINYLKANGCNND